MATILGAIKVGQGRPLDRDDAPSIPSITGRSGRPGSLLDPGSPAPSALLATPASAAPASDAQQPAAAGDQSTPQTRTSSESHVQPGTPTSASAPAPAAEPTAATTPVSAASPQPVIARKAPRLSRGPSAIATKEPELVRQQPTSATSVQSSGASVNASSIDPLSQHILFRTNTDSLRSSKLRAQPTTPDSPVPDAPSPLADTAIRFSSPSVDVGKEKKKGFLGRLSMRGSRKKEDASDNASEFGEPRTEGSNAHVFSSIVDSAGFIPHHKEPPRYIGVKMHNKKVKEFDRMFLAQELIGTRPPKTETGGRIPIVTVSTAGQGRKKTATGGAVWTTEFSKDGKYLAAGGRDHVVRVWAVISTAEDRRAQEEEEAQNGGAGERLSAPVFLEKPVQEFAGHTGEILDVSWSKNNFLLSTSMDKTVRLWHISRQECLCTFKHKELVSKVAFHPKDDRFFLAGCLDATLRLWSIPDKNVAFSAQLPDMITAVAFSPDGKMAIAGLLSGFCYLLETEGLKPLTQIHVRSSRGRNAKGSKITGIVPMLPSNGKHGDAVILVTSTDARVRLYSLRDKTLDCKFKGHEHSSSQLSASFSDDGKYVICGSEARKVFIWSVSPSDSITKDKYPCETFDAHGEVVTTAIFAPTKTRQLLGGSGDPIYDLCNPPPITLMSLEETLASLSGMSNNTLHQDDTSQPPPPPQPPRARPEESPAYISRSTHYDGNIIVTSDDTGIIKVFRQDCAANKRRHESWETGSSFSRKLGANSGLVGRSGSIITRTSSSAAHSRRGSLSQPPPHLNTATGTPQPAGGNLERINSWRQGIEGGNSRPSSLIGTGVAPARTERSVSPSKASQTPMGISGGLASDARKQPYAATTSSPLSPHFSVNQNRASMPLSPTSSPLVSSRQAERLVPATPGDRTPNATATSSTVPATANHGGLNITKPAPPNVAYDSLQMAGISKEPENKDKNEKNEHGPEHLKPPGPSLTFRSDEDALRLDPAGASYSFWNLNKWKGIANLRASLSGAGTSEPTAALDSTNSAAAHHNDTTIGANLRRSFGVNILPKSPLSKSDAAADGDSAASAPHSPRPGHSRQKSSGMLSHLTPTITIADNSGHDTSHLYPPSRSHSPYARSGSVVSRLSSEMTSSEGETDGEGAEMRCTKCGGREFKARRVSGVQKLQCSRCGKVVEEGGKKV